MEKIIKRVMNVDARLWQLITFLLFSVSLLFTVFQASLVRFIESVRDAATSVAYWFLFAYSYVIDSLFGTVPDVRATILDFPSTSFEEVLNIDFDLIFAKFERFPKAYFKLLPDYNVWILDTLYWLSLYVMMLSPVLISLPFIVKTLMLSPKDKSENRVSRPAKAFLLILEKIVSPVRSFFRSYLDFMEQHKVLTVILVVVWLLNFNIFTVIFEVIGFYYYFISTFAFAAFLTFLLKLLLDVLILLLCMPAFYWLIVLGRVFLRVCENIGNDRLRHFEAKNCGFLKTLDIVTLIIGEPGKGKTTLLTDFVLSWVNIYKTETLKTMTKFHLLFPCFPFSAFRDDLTERILNHEIFCLPQVNDYVDSMYQRYEKTLDRAVFYGYRDDLFRTSVDVGNRDVSLEDALKIYGRAFLIYYNNNPSLSNYPIRFNGTFDDSEHLRLWNGDFFCRKPVERFSRILNQDMLRHGKKIDSDSKEVGAFGYGIYSHTELAKSVGNQHTNAIYDVKSDEANPKNDKHSYSYMMGRHPFSTVDNFVYFRYIGDEQRASSLMAEELGLMSVLSIADKGDQLIALPAFNWFLNFRQKITASFSSFLKERENVRGDVTLSMLLLTLFVGSVDLFGLQIENRYGYREITLDRQQGSAFSGNTGTANTAGGINSHVYYQANMKTYSDRFMTDCYSNLYAQAQKSCGIGIMDMKEYGSLEMSVPEMEYQRDHFMRNLMTMIHGPSDFGEKKGNDARAERRRNVF